MTLPPIAGREQVSGPVREATPPNATVSACGRAGRATLAVVQRIDAFESGVDVVTRRKGDARGRGDHLR